MKEVHIGPLPPPLGGISVYLYRLSKIKKEAQFIDVKKFKTSLEINLWLLKQVFALKKKNFIYHSPSLKTRLKLFLLSCISIHDFSLVIHGSSLIDHYKKSRKITKYLTKCMLNSANFIQVVDPNIQKFIKDLGIKNKNIFIKDAFLPPPPEDEKKILNSYEKELFEFIELRDPILISNAGFIRFYNNVDLYGLDMCVNLTNLLKKDYPNIGYIFALADEKINSQYLKIIKEQIKKLNIENNFYFITGQKEIWPIFKKVDIMIRPTYKDGYGISIAEALYFNCPAIASDVCKRPNGTILFKNRDLEDLYEKIKCVLIKKEKG